LVKCKAYAFTQRGAKHGLSHVFGSFSAIQEICTTIDEWTLQAVVPRVFHKVIYLCNEMLLLSLPFDARQIIVVKTRDKIVVVFFIIIIFCKDNQFEKDIVPLRREI